MEDILDVGTPGKTGEGEKAGEDGAEGSVSREWVGYVS